MKRITISLIAALLLSPAVASAQYYYYGYPDYGYYGGGYSYGGYHSSTAAEGYGRGLADVIRSRGIYNSLSADAAVRLEDARRKYIENYQQGVETYFHIRDFNRSRRAQQLAADREEVRQWLQQRQPYQPERPNTTQLEPTTGEINWPLALLDDDFKGRREKLEQLFQYRAGVSGLLSAEDYVAVITTGNEMLAQLKNRLDDLRPAEYMVAKKLIEALMNEAALPSS